MGQTRFFPKGLTEIRRIKGMNENRDHGPALSKVLREWRAVPLPPRFQENVWRRIQRTDAGQTSGVSLWDGIARWIETILPRPVVAVSYASLLMIIGFGAGWSRGMHETARIKQELGQSYIQTLDPNQAGRGSMK